MVFNVESVSSVTETWRLVEITKIAPNIRIVHNSLLVAFEMTHINWIKSNQCSVETHISLCDGWTGQVTRTR